MEEVRGSNPLSSTVLARVAAAASLFAAASCGGNGPAESTSPSISPIPADLDRFAVTSPAFEEGGPIPEQFTCDGEGSPPPLEWSGVPEGSAELILTLLDPDAPQGVFTHWTVYAISPDAEGLPQGRAPATAAEGINDFGDVGYGGPCPPEGESHRYIFTLAALAEPSGLFPGEAPAAVDRVLQRAVATTTLTGRYPG